MQRPHNVSQTEAVEYGYASSVVLAFADCAAVIEKNIAAKSRRRRSSTSCLKQGAFRDFLVSAAQQVQAAHDAGVSKHAADFEQGDGESAACRNRMTADRTDASRETLLALAIDMRVSVLGILEIACAHEKDTRLLEHMHDIADSNRHLAVKALEELSMRLDAQWPLSEAKRLSKRLSSSSQTLIPAYAPNLLKLRGTPEIPEEVAPSPSIGHPKIETAPVELDSHGEQHRMEGLFQCNSFTAETIDTTPPPRKRNLGRLPGRWLRSVFCMSRSSRSSVRSGRESQEMTQTHGPGLSGPPALIAQMPAPVELPGSPVTVNPHVLPALAELDDSSTLRSLSSITECSVDSKLVPMTPRTPDTMLSYGMVSREVSSGKLTSHFSEKPSPALDTVDPLDANTSLHGFCTGAETCRDASDPRAALRLDFHAHADGPTLHWACKACLFYSPALPELLTDADTLPDAADISLPQDINIGACGIGYRWRFLARSHLPCRPVSRIPTGEPNETSIRVAPARYGCIFCAALHGSGNVSLHDGTTNGCEREVFDGADALLRHVDAEHAGRMEPAITKALHCVDGRIADDKDETWDLNICLFE